MAQEEDACTLYPISVDVRWAKNLANDALMRGFSVRADEAAEDGGDDTGPNPAELLLAAAGSCLAITIEEYLKKAAIPLQSLSVAPFGHLAMEDGLEHLRFTVTIKAGADKAQLEAIAEKALAASPVVLSLKAAKSLVVEVVEN